MDNNPTIYDMIHTLYANIMNTAQSINTDIDIDKLIENTILYKAKSYSYNIIKPLHMIVNLMFYCINIFKFKSASASASKSLNIIDVEITTYINILNEY